MRLGGGAGEADGDWDIVVAVAPRRRRGSVGMACGWGTDAELRPPAPESRVSSAGGKMGAKPSERSVSAHPGGES